MITIARVKAAKIAEKYLRITVVKKVFLCIRLLFVLAQLFSFPSDKVSFVIRRYSKARKISELFSRFFGQMTNDYI